MSNSNAGGEPDNEWNERGDVAWNEFDWERYLREQDEAVERYARHYAACQDPLDRIDEVAERMHWGEDEAAEAEAGDEDEDPEEDGVYTLHRNPIYVASRGIHLTIARAWEKLAADPARVPPPLALAFLGSLQRGQDLAMQAVHALDFGDFAMAVSLFKRALAALNGTLALLNADAALRLPRVRAWREEALPRLFDLREVWLRVIAECRDELERPLEDAEDDED